MRNLMMLWLLTPFAAFAVEPITQELHLVHSQVSPAPSESPVEVSFALEGENLVATFTVHTRKIYAKPHLSAGQYPYQWDVVELFVSASPESSHFPYTEFELSPYNQTFDVRVTGPPLHFTNGIATDSTHSVKMLPEENGLKGWQGTLVISLKSLGWDGNPAHVTGNAFSVVGAPHERVYWSLFLPPQTQPAFHHPEFFRPLLSP